MSLPDIKFVREQRDPDFDCEAFTTKSLALGERAECETDGHYRCWECKRRDPKIVFDSINGLVRGEGVDWN